MLKNEKINNWKTFCINLNPSCSYNVSGPLPGGFKNCLNPTKCPSNVNGFYAFCSKVTPWSIPLEIEVGLFDHFYTLYHYVLTNYFNMTELNLTIYSRKFTASDLDNISPVLKHLFANDLVSLLNIINNLMATQQFLVTRSCYREIPVPKPYFNTCYRPLAICSSLCKIFEYILNTRLVRLVNRIKFYSIAQLFRI